MNVVRKCLGASRRACGLAARLLAKAAHLLMVVSVRAYASAPPEPGRSEIPAGLLERAQPCIAQAGHGSMSPFLHDPFRTGSSAMLGTILLINLAGAVALLL
ncbi:hypothetical protein P4193_05665 [Pseudomonas aeruginosa]|nr:hypothetical protein [Pseudomonas aeruginosa]